jgi:hypothetical protein
VIKTRRAVRVSGGGSDPKNKEDREGWFRYVSRRESKGGGGVRFEEGIIRTRMFAKIEGNVYKVRRRRRKIEVDV